MSAPTKDELLLIQQFRQQLSDVLETDEHRSDAYLLRWIRAREGSLDKAENMLRNSLKWRKENDTDNILKREMDLFCVKNYPFRTTCSDLEGRVVIEVHLGIWDCRKVITAKKETEFTNYITFFLESISLKIRENNISKPEGEWPMTQLTFIFDFQDYAYSQLFNWKAMQTFLGIGTQFEAHYPEVVHQVYFVNCPAFLPIIMKLMKSVLAPRTYDKFNCFGTNKEEWEPILTKIIDPKLLWTRLGGNQD